MKRKRKDFDLARQLPGHSQLERVRAARAMLNSTRSSEEMELRAFLSIFHPEISAAKRRAMARAAAAA